MSYRDDKKIAEAAEALRWYCSINRSEEFGCETSCIFFNSVLKTCKISDQPSYWEEPELKRWTPEDVAMARLLKVAGATDIYGTSSGQRSWRDDCKNGGYLPEGAFRNVFPGDEVRIDDIIKEGEEVNHHD